MKELNIFVCADTKTNKYEVIAIPMEDCKRMFHISHGVNDLQSAIAVKQAYEFGRIDGFNEKEQTK